MEKVKRWLWRTKLQLYFFFKRLINEVRLEYEARKYSKGKFERECYKAWRKRRLIRFEECSPEDQALWIEEERLKWQDYYDGLL